MKRKWKQGEAIVFAPKWAEGLSEPYAARLHPLKPQELVYFLCNIPNVPGHCIVAKYSGAIVPMVHPEDFRKAREDEL